MGFETYDRSKLVERIVHFGVGNFFRAHLAVYQDELISQGLSDWSICGVGLMPGDVHLHDALASQDMLCTVLERGSTATRARVIGSLTSFMLTAREPQAVLDKLASAEVKIVSLTITESGYLHVEADDDLDMHNTDLQHDLAAPTCSSAARDGGGQRDRHGQGEGHSDGDDAALAPPPRTVYGFLCRALERRYAAGLPPFTVMSCDNLQQNGDLTRRMLLRFMELRRSPALEWVRQYGAFPNSMVDRITPRTTPDVREMLQERWAILDAWPVPTETYTQWVLDAHFADGRPPWERVGVQVVDDVAPYELMKLRLLNAGHSALGYLGALLGHTYIHEAAADPDLRRFLQALHREVVPLLPPIAGVDFVHYCDTLLERFGNAAIRDLVSRICSNGSGKMPQFLLPSIKEHLQRQEEQPPHDGQERGDAGLRSPPMLTLCVAAWFRYLTGEDEARRSYAVEDPLLDELQPLARSGGADPGPLLDGAREVFCEYLSHSPAFRRDVGTALAALYERGARATLGQYLAL